MTRFQKKYWGGVIAGYCVAIDVLILMLFTGRDPSIAIYAFDIPLMFTSCGVMHRIFNGEWPR
jgi:hypothetical protein